MWKMALLEFCSTVDLRAQPQDSLGMALSSINAQLLQEHWNILLSNEDHFRSRTTQIAHKKVVSMLLRRKDEEAALLLANRVLQKFDRRYMPQLIVALCASNLIILYLLNLFSLRKCRAAMQLQGHRKFSGKDHSRRKGLLQVLDWEDCW